MNDKTKPAKTKPARTKLAKTKLAETEPADLWEQTKAWADKNRTISGALLGGAAGTIVPLIGTVIGTIVGAGWICLIAGKRTCQLAAARGQRKHRLAELAMVVGRLVPAGHRRTLQQKVEIQ